MFGFLSRKLNPPASSSSGTIDPTAVHPSDTSPAVEPPATPSPSPGEPITDAKPLHSLIASVPAQTLQAYILSHLIPPSQPLSPLTFPHIPLPTGPPTPKILTALTDFFANLVPPPRLHCVRCHKWYFEVENTDRSCLVPHDDESAEVERVGAIGRSKGIGTEYETLWGCCGRTVEGDGDMGPPDGWCYEGKHTTDVKRARFRADSTLQDDKLTSCERLRCHKPPSSSPSASRSGANKRRRTLMEEADNADVQSSVDGSTLSSSSNMIVDESASARKPKRARHSKSTSLSSKPELDKNSKRDITGDDAAMDVDVSPTEKAQVPTTPKSPPRPRKPRKSGGTTTTTLGPKPAKKSPLVSSFTPPSPPVENATPSQECKEKSSLPRNRAIVEITTERDGSPRLSSSRLRKDSNISLSDTFKSDNDTQSEKETKPKSRARRNTVVDPTTTTTPKTPKVTPRSKRSTADASIEIKSSTPPSSTKPKSSRTVKPKSSVASLKTTANANVTSCTTTITTRSGSTGKRGGKTLSEIVATSLEEEQNL